MQTLARLPSHLFPFAVELLRLSVWFAILVAVFVPLERIFPLQPQKVFRKAFLCDLAWYFVSSLVPGLILVVPMALLGWLLHGFVPSGLRAGAASLPIGIRLAAALVVGEFGFYWGHRWSHEIPFLWKFHALHHSAEQLDWLVNTRAHPVDMIFTRLCGLVPLYVLGLSQPRPRTPDAVSLMVILTGTVWGFFIHANLKWRFGPLEWLVSTPAFHHWHHTYSGPVNRNYASMLPWVDHIFGTWHMPKAQWPERYGTETAVPDGFAGQLTQPLMSAARSARPFIGPAGASH